MHIICEDNTWSDKDVGTDVHTLQKCMSVNPDIIAETATILNYRFWTNAAVISEDIVIKHRCLITQVKIVSSGNGFINGTPRSNEGIRTYHCVGIRVKTVTDPHDGERLDDRISPKFCIGVHDSRWISCDIGQSSELTDVVEPSAAFRINRA